MKTNYYFVKAVCERDFLSTTEDTDVCSLYSPRKGSGGILGAIVFSVGKTKTTRWKVNEKKNNNHSTK